MSGAFYVRYHVIKRISVPQLTQFGPEPNTVFQSNPFRNSINLHRVQGGYAHIDICKYIFCCGSYSLCGSCSFADRPFWVHHLSISIAHTKYPSNKIRSGGARPDFPRTTRIISLLSSHDHRLGFADAKAHGNWRVYGRFGRRSTRIRAMCAFVVNYARYGLAVRNK